MTSLPQDLWWPVGAMLGALLAHTYYTLRQWWADRIARFHQREYAKRRLRRCVR